MVTFEKFVEELVNQGTDRKIVEKLIEEYKIVKRERLLGDHEKVILHSAKVCDLTLALIKNKVTGRAIDINEIRFNKLLEEIRKYPKTSAEEVILTLAIPRVAESIYTIRSKKNVAHVKTIDPNFIDSSYCISACDWILSELALLFYVSDPKEADELINSILEKKVPLIEEFEDGSIVILKKDMLVNEQFLVCLYYNYPDRMRDEDLTATLRYENRAYAEKILDKFEREKLIHRSEDGNKLTKLGIKFVEDKILAEKARVAN